MDQQTTKRLTTAQAIITFLKNQYVERDEAEQPFFAGCFGIFGHGNIAGIGQALQHIGIDLETQQCEPVRGEKRLDLRQRETVLLHMEQEVATIAGVVEITAANDGPCRRCLIKREDVLPAAPDVVRLGRMPARGNHRARSHDVVASTFCVEAQAHEAARLDDVCKRAQPGCRIGEVMQHTDRRHDVEPATERFHIK